MPSGFPDFSAIARAFRNSASASAKWPCWRREAAFCRKDAVSPSASSAAIAVPARPANPIVTTSRTAPIRDAQWLPRKVNPAFTNVPNVLDDCAKQFFLVREMGIDRRLRDTGLARDQVHADRAEAVGEKGAFGAAEDRFSLSRSFCFLGHSTHR